MQRGRGGRRAGASPLTADLTWQAFADAIPDLVVRIDASGTIVYASRAAGALGYEPRDLVGRRAAEFVHPEDLASHQTIAAAVFSTTPAPATVRREHRFRRKDGGWVWLRGNPVILPQAEGEPVEVLNILRDVTREVTTAQAGRRKLQEALEQAQQAAVAKSQFLSNMSHEIRTPLTAVIGFAGLLAEREDLDPDAARYVARIGGAGRSLQAIVNDVLDFAKLEAGQMTFQPRPASAHRRGARGAGGPRSAGGREVHRASLRGRGRDAGARGHRPRPPAPDPAGAGRQCGEIHRPRRGHPAPRP